MRTSARKIEIVNTERTAACKFMAFFVLMGFSIETVLTPVLHAEGEEKDHGGLVTCGMGESGRRPMLH